MFLILFSCNSNIIIRLDDLEEQVADHEQRLQNLEKLCDQLNHDAATLQILLNYVQAQETIISITETKDGYSLTFSNGHTIYIRNGQNGADGQNGTTGANGADGLTPVIGIAQDEDGIYYWTLNGLWLYDSTDNKIPVNGANGNDGEQGANGIIPQFKIEHGDWYISTDNGTTWQYLGQATGDKGEQGDKGETGDKGEQGDTGAKGETGDAGAAGQDGVSLFVSVTYDDNHVYITLADGTVLTLPRATNNTITITFDPNGGAGEITPITLTPCVCVTLPASSFTPPVVNLCAVSWNTAPDGTGISYAFHTTCTFSQNLTLYAQWELSPYATAFSIGENRKVLISSGNLQYQASTNTFRFAPMQYTYIGRNNLQASATYDGWIDHFAWGTGNNPIWTSADNADYSIFTDWGINAIDDYIPNTWRTPTYDELYYLLYSRPNAGQLKGFAIITDNEASQYGSVLLPDMWIMPEGMTYEANVLDYSNNTYTPEEWGRMEANGAVFLPATGWMNSLYLNNLGEGAAYWTNTICDENKAYYLGMYRTWTSPSVGNAYPRHYRHAVRLIKDID